MQKAIRSALDHAREISDQLRKAKADLGFQRGDQMCEDKTAEQLDRWSIESKLGEGLTAALAHTEHLIQELEGLDEALGHTDSSCS
jgi:hypothetical protein